MAIHITSFAKTTIKVMDPSLNAINQSEDELSHDRNFKPFLNAWSSAASLYQKEKPLLHLGNAN